MENKHTPGPWHVINEWNVSGPEYEVANGSIMVRDDDESAANARIIAAAPDLLEALEMALNFIANTESEMGETLQSGDAARAAIAKARGQ